MFKNFFKWLILLVSVIASISVFAAPKSLSDQQEYKDIVELIKRSGREVLIKNIVKAQRYQMKNYGGALDEYTDVVSIVGSAYGTTQIVKVKIEKLIEDINYELKEKGKKQLSKNDAFSLLKEGGGLYKMQVNMLCTNPSTRALIDNNIEYVSKYYEQNMSFIAEIVVDSDVCIKHVQQ
jgi:hypothetical protein